MKVLLAAAAVASLCAFAAPASAGTYVNLGYTFIDDDDANLGAIIGRFGWKSTSFFGVEGEAAFGVQDDTVSGVKVELNSQFAVYGTVTAPLTDSFDVFARIGYGTNDFKVSGGGASASGNDESWNFGVGAQYFFDGRNGIRGDYTHLDFNNGGNADAWTISWVYRFQ